MKTPRKAALPKSITASRHLEDIYEQHLPGRCHIQARGADPSAPRKGGNDV